MRLKLASASLALALGSAAGGHPGIEPQGSGVTNQRLAKDVASSYNRGSPLDFRGLECDPSPSSTGADSTNLRGIVPSKPDAGVLGSPPCGGSGRLSCVPDPSSASGGRCRPAGHYFAVDEAERNLYAVSFRYEPCVSEDDCRAAAERRGYGDLPFRVGDYPNKGCYSNVYDPGGVFWSPVGDEEVTYVSGRLWCNGLNGRDPEDCTMGGPYYTGLRRNCYWDNQFCKLDDGQCDPTKRWPPRWDDDMQTGGNCEDVPKACPGDVDPVCGCDGITHKNACEASAKRVSIVLDRACDSTPEVGEEEGTPEVGEEEGTPEVGEDEGTIPCLTVEECRVRSEELGFPRFEQGDFPTKGCFSKNDVAFFSPGTDSEVSKVALPGVQERILCDADVACLFEEDCKRMSDAMGFESFASGNYPTKGCFSKNDQAFFSPGTAIGMSRVNLPGVQERIWCTELWKVAGTAACLTAEECNVKSQDKGLGPMVEGSFPSKGCFSKNGKAFFSVGTKGEMSDANLPGVQERIWCDVDEPL